MCEKIRSAIEFYRWESLHPALKVALSQGLADKNDDTPDVETLLRKADRRLYEAKNAGRNRVGLGNGEPE